MYMQCKVIKPIMFKIDKEHSAYKNDYYFNTDDVITIKSNFLGSWSINLLYRDLSFVGEFEKPMSEILNEYIKELEIIDLYENDLRKILSKKYKCKMSDIIFSIDDEDDEYKISVIIRKEK